MAAIEKTKKRDAFDSIDNVSAGPKLKSVNTMIVSKIVLISSE